MERDWRLIYAKTPEGLTEASIRQRILLPSVRRVLILADGQRTLGDLAMFVRAGELDPIIRVLEVGGFITLTGIAGHLPERREDWQVWGYTPESLEVLKRKLRDLLMTEHPIATERHVDAIMASTDYEVVRLHLRHAIDAVELTAGLDTARALLATVRKLLAPPEPGQYADAPTDDAAPPHLSSRPLYSTTEHAAV